MPEELKRCTKCGETKERTAFYKHLQQKDGLSSNCKECCRLSALAYWHIHKEERQGYRQVYRKARQEESREYHRIYRECHREERRENNKTYKQTHPVEIYDYNAKRRARKLQAPICDLTKEQWRAIKALYAHKCAYCGKKMRRLTMDHVIPLAKGGNHTASNIVPACQPCNSKKHTKVAPVHQPHLLGALGLLLEERANA